MTKQEQKPIEFEQVTVKVSKRLMRLIQDQNYFGRTPEKFFTDSIRRSVSCELNEMPNDEAIRLERKYGIKAEIVVDLSKCSL